MSIAVVLDTGATLIDFVGPWETFVDANFVAKKDLYRMFTVGPSRAPLNIGGGLTVIPDYTFDDAPQPQLVVIGAQGNGTDPNKLAWIRKVFPRTKLTMSICTGAFILARTGLLDGKKATTHHDYFDKFAKEFPQVELVRGTRFVDQGQLGSGGGLSSGIDAALQVVERQHGRDLAVKLASYMEYYDRNWAL
jgi:transcriptional regulator GlxA family with amidase domain